MFRLWASADIPASTLSGPIIICVHVLIFWKAWVVKVCWKVMGPFSKKLGRVCPIIGLGQLLPFSGDFWLFRRFTHWTWESSCQSSWCRIVTRGRVGAVPDQPADRKQQPKKVGCWDITGIDKNIVGTDFRDLVAHLDVLSSHEIQLVGWGQDGWMCFPISRHFPTVDFHLSRLSFVFLLLHSLSVDSFSRGSPESACEEDMRPRHGFATQVPFYLELCTQTFPWYDMRDQRGNLNFGVKWGLPTWGVIYLYTNTSWWNEIFATICFPWQFGQLHEYVCISYSVCLMGH